MKSLVSVSLLASILLSKPCISFGQTSSDFSHASGAISRDLTKISGWIADEASRIISVNSTIGTNYSLLLKPVQTYHAGLSVGLGNYPLDVERLRNLNTEVIDTRQIEIPENGQVPKY